MSKPTPTTPSAFVSIDAPALDRVAGGASRVSARGGAGNEQLTAMLTQVTSSIKDLAGKQNSGSDPMQMMMMMMMMGGGGGGGSAAPAPAPAPAPPPMPQISITNTSS